MNLLVFSLLVLSLYVARTFENPDSTPECPEGEEYMECRYCGSSCRILPKLLFMKCACNPGCDCSKGYKNSQGICVPLEQCECPFNAIFTRCDNNDCVGTCKKPYRLENQTCPCRAGCVCNEGYLRNDARECVLPIQCECPENELYMDCHGCEDTCRNPHLSSSSTCPCYLKCYCLSGYLRNDEGKCVRPKECLNRCPNANEEYSQCGTACPRTCSNKDELALKCTKNCVQGCFCLDGYVRDDSGVCILPENCPGPVCGANQVYDKCPPNRPAESTCKNIFKATLPEHPNPCKPGCKCKTGFLRIGKECVVEGKCCTDPNAELVKNPPCCGGGTCAKPDWITGCGKKSDPKGCQCKKGYCKKSETDATCIAVKDCKKHVSVPYVK